MKKYLPILFAALAFVLPFGLYIKTLAPTYIPIDAAEFTLCVHFWGVCHSPGFPFYVMIGKFFTTIFPFGTLIYKVNLLSAIYGAGTILFLYLTLVVLGVRRGISLFLVLFFAATNVFWEFSLSADVFTFSTFLLVIAFYFLLKNRRNLAFFALGLSASHFYISVVLAPIFCWYFFWDEVSNVSIVSKVSKVWRKIFIAAAIFSLGFFPQVVMFFRMLAHPQISWGHVQNFGDYVNYLRRKEFGSIFLIANPVLTFSLVKMFKQFWFFWQQLFFDFMAIVPLLVLFAIGHLRFLKDKKVLFMIISLLVLSSMQLFLLSTIDPSGADNPFQLNKFYLTSFVIFILISGLTLQFLGEKLFGEDQTYIQMLLGILIIIAVLSNYHSHNYSKNHFTENFVDDAISKVPKNAIVITVDHPFYFGGLYEQKINHKFENITLLYFPNDKNRDSEAYHPEVFRRSANNTFVSKIKEGKTLGAAEEYVTSTIAKNLDRPIYIVQGSFESNFFSYLKPYIEPYGLFWRVILDPKSKVDPQDIKNQFEGFQNTNFKKDDFDLRQQGFEAQVYAIAYFNSGHLLAINGNFAEALDLFDRSLVIDSSAKSVSDERNFVSEIKKMADGYGQLIQNKDKETLTNLGSDLIKLGAYQKAVEVFSAILNFSAQDAPTLNNLASAYAYGGDRENAVKYYHQALLVDPNLDLAKKGLAALGIQ